MKKEEQNKQEIKENKRKIVILETEKHLKKKKCNFPVIHWKKLISHHQKETGEIGIVNNFFTNNISNKYFEKLKNKIEWKKKNIFIFGKKILQPRLVSFSNKNGKSYSYSGQTIQSQEWIEELEEISNILKEFLNIDFNSVQMNLYEDGNHYIAPHSDDEPLWGDNPIIASLSFGETRKFILEEKFDKNSNSSSKQKKSYSFYLSNGSLLVMKGETQKYWKHSISKDKNITKPRINLTFRKMI